MTASGSPRLLEISTRPYLYLLSQRTGKTITKLREIPDSEFKSWKAKGFEYVWFMGLWQVGEYGRNHDLTDKGLINAYDSVLPGWTEDDVIGSPYAIVDYKLNTVLGEEDDVKWLAEKLHSYGMKLMVDFVPNHSAVDSPTIKTNIEFYIRAPSSVTPSEKKYLPNGVAYGCGIWCDPWTDVAQYNYFDQGLRDLQISRLKSIAKYADGVRCDMAHLVLNDAFADYWKTELEAWGYKKPATEFWADAIKETKKVNPNFIFLAESYGDTLFKLQQCGFDYTYDKAVLDNLMSFNTEEIRNIYRYADMNYQLHCAHFTENHDERRTVDEFSYNYKAACAAASAALTLPGMRFVFQDQWLGYANKLDVHLRRALYENTNPAVAYHFKKLFEILGHEAFTNGNFKYLEINGSPEILTWKWTNENERILVTINFSDKQKGGAVVLDDAPQGSASIPVEDLMTGTVYDRDPSELRTNGLYVLLDGWQSQVFKY